MGFAKSFRNDALELVADHLRRYVAKHALHRRLAEQNTTLGIDGEDRIGRGLGDDSITLLAFAQRQRGFVALDVLADLRSDERDCGQQRLIHFPRAAAEELHCSDHGALMRDREGKRGLDSGSLGAGRPRKTLWV